MAEANFDLKWFDFVEINAKDLQDRLLNAGLADKTVDLIVEIVLNQVGAALGFKFIKEPQLLHEILSCLPKYDAILRNTIRDSHSSLLMHVLERTGAVYRQKFTEQWMASRKVVLQKDEKLLSLNGLINEKTAHIELLQKENRRLLELSSPPRVSDKVSRARAINDKDHGSKDNGIVSRKRPASPSPIKGRPAEKREQYEAVLEVTAVALRYPQVDSSFLDYWDDAKVPCVFFAHGQCKNAIHRRQCRWSHDQLNYEACRLALEKLHRKKSHSGDGMEEREGGFATDLSRIFIGTHL